MTISSSAGHLRVIRSSVSSRRADVSLHRWRHPERLMHAAEVKYMKFSLNEWALRQSRYGSQRPSIGTCAQENRRRLWPGFTIVEDRKRSSCFQHSSSSSSFCGCSGLRPPTRSEALSTSSWLSRLSSCCSASLTSEIRFGDKRVEAADALGIDGRAARCSADQVTGQLAMDPFAPVAWRW
jgi:hypothetical protein